MSSNNYLSYIMLELRRPLLPVIYNAGVKKTFILSHQQNQFFRDERGMSISVRVNMGIQFFHYLTKHLNTRTLQSFVTM